MFRVAHFVPMEHQTVGRQSHGHEMVGDEEIHDVVLLRIVVVCGSLGVISVLDEIVLHVLHGDVQGVLAQFLFPELIGLGKEGVAVEAVLGHFARCVADTRCVRDVLDEAGLVAAFVFVVLVLVEGV